MFGDESSINLAYTRLYGRALKNKRVKEGIKDVRFKRKSIISTVRLNGENCTLTFEGTLNKELMAEYIRTQLKPMLKEDDVYVIDNSNVHKSKLVQDTFAECGIKVLFLPRYSPDFNPIELMWTKVKSVLKKLKARTQDKLESTLNTALDSVKVSFVENWFRHCGYSL